MRVVCFFLFVIIGWQQVFATNADMITVRKDLYLKLIQSAEHDKAVSEAELIELIDQRRILPDGRTEAIYQLHDTQYRVILKCSQIESIEKSYSFWDRVKTNALLLLGGVTMGFIAGFAARGN